jgi:hypothetical protein
LKAFTASKLTQTVFYHRDLGTYSQPGESLDAFRSRLADRLKEMKTAKASELKQGYVQRLQAAKGDIGVAEDEYASIEKLVGEIKSEIKSLEKEKGARNPGRSRLSSCHRRYRPGRPGSFGSRSVSPS